MILLIQKKCDILLSMINATTYPGVWGTAHIIYFAVTIVLLVGSLFLIKRYVKNERTIKLIVKITAACLLALFITNRIGYMVRYIYIEPREGYTWMSVLPETFCSVTSLIFSIAVLCFRKNNCLIHGSICMALVGAIETTFYPDFLNTQGLWEVGTITSLFYHTVMLFLVLLIIITNYVRLTIKKWYIQPIVFMMMICYGLFYWQVLLGGKNFDCILGINIPIIASQPILTSWWMFGIGYLLFEIIFLALYDRFVNKKTFKMIGFEFIHFYRYINK